MADTRREIVNIFTVLAAVVFLLTALGINLSVILTVPFGLFLLALGMIVPVSIGGPVVVNKA